MHYQPNVDLAFTSVEHAVIEWIIIFIYLEYFYIFSLYIKTFSIKFFSNTFYMIYKLVSTKSIDSNYTNFIESSDNPNCTFTEKRQIISLQETKTIKEMSDDDFIEWLRGFTDGEGSFIISINKYENSEGKISNSVSFKYVLFLHKDDAPMLNELRDRLSIGTVKIYDRFVNFQVSKSSEIEKIIEIFSKNNLNTSKHLNFLEFRKAYSLYHNKLDNGISKKKLNRLDNLEEILKIKNTMNRKRINFELPKDHFIKITPYWLLGFVEGEGSFSISKNNYFSQELGISQTISEKKSNVRNKTFFVRFDWKLSN